MEEPLDHSLRYGWSASVLPNNYLFYLRTEEKRMRVHNVGSNLHGSHEFVISLRGNGHVCLEDKVYLVTPGTAFLVKPGQFHSYFGFEQGGFSWLLFKFDLSEEESAHLASRRVCLLSEGDMQSLQDIGRRYLQKLRSEGERYRIAAEMGELLHVAGSRPSVEPLGSLQAPEFKACQLLYQIAHFSLKHIDQAIRIQDIADYLEVSESNLRKIFREEFKVSLGAYLRNTRFARGVQLLTNTEMSISEISQRSGFESVASFSQAFRKGLGVTPSCYRQQAMQRRKEVPAMPPLLNPEPRL